MSDPMKEIMASFFVECEELHESLVDALQTMADGESDIETINVAFRAVHSIKGGAGAFGLNDLVEFAHQFETVMDACRSGTLVPDDALHSLFLRCADMLSDLIRCSRDGEEIDSGTSATLIGELSTYVGGGHAEPEPVIDFQPMTLEILDIGGDFGGLPALDLPTPDAEPASTGGSVTVEFRPEGELYESGNEPLFLLKTLADLGPCEIECAFAPPDSMLDLDRPGGRLTWTIRIGGEATAAAAQEVFEFAEGLCHLRIVGDGAAAPARLDRSSAPDMHSEVSEDVGEIPMPPVSAASPMPASREMRSEPRATAPQPKASPTVRVDLDRIERLVNLVGELVINQAMLSQSIAAQNIPPNSPVSAGLDEFMQLTRNIQESVMMIRAQPVKSLFQRMSRIVREASAAVNKTVRLVTEGDATEIDKTAIERLADPLTHMIRNAVDHGLESTERRLAAGKPKTGEIRLSAAHRSGRVIIEVSDDGGGINREKVRTIAAAKGLIPEDATLSDAEIDQLLFLPGFSTATEVSALSGRGVGMDVVKTQIASLGGRVTIDSVAGAGTTFSISLPLTLAVLDGMVVTVADETLVVPLNAIVETLSLSTSDLRLVGPGQQVLCVREQFVPVLDLGVELGYRDASQVREGTIALLISPEEGVLVALLVDTIEDQRQVVIKGLQESYGHVPGVAAATILGDGQIALILDPNDLVQNASGEDRFVMQKKAS